MLRDDPPPERTPQARTSRRRASTVGSLRRAIYRELADAAARSDVVQAPLTWPLVAPQATPHQASP
ncbi:hypothetical protein [Saccharopolyspora thermophila]|nr:hypothetical protein [Saccharopolyspora subtropica]